MNEYPLDWHRAHGEPVATAELKRSPADFEVDEELPFEPSDEGEHLLVRISKVGANTEWVAGRLAKYVGIPRRDVGFAGRKDRRAVTRQWFSLWVRRDDPDVEGFEDEGVQVIEARRHARKLKRGAVKANRFRVVLRAIPALGEREEALNVRLQAIAALGVPNYFGEQRFGRDGHNIRMAEALLSDRVVVRKRHERGLYLSAARSYLFNQCLSEKVKSGTWQGIISAGTGQDLALYGLGHPSSPKTAARAYRMGPEEARVLAAKSEWCRGLERLGLRVEYRRIALEVSELEWRRVGDDSISLTFRLPKGGYATSMLREVVEFAIPDSEV